MKAIETPIPDCFIIEPTIFSDDRGTFFESYQKERFESAIGRQVDFVQDNQSMSKKGVLRGLHFQEGIHAQAKLIRVLQGEVLDVIVDIRKDSPAFGTHFKIFLKASKPQMLFIPRGIAHGFLSLTEETIFSYKCDNYYHQKAENGIVFNDPDLGIDWEFPQEQMLLSQKDLELPSLKKLGL
ncbi:dTDP-4-dehydrorhamnose 3,5-epimerase [Spongiimicrobium salis]|uniref:dTDP-4-dehydrorhamnose 3,5-epimerase n=1 Tax=Spongiimicrobium salis TaxID=1667022 RepID=UPI00374DAA07